MADTQQRVAEMIPLYLNWIRDKRTVLEKEAQKLQRRTRPRQAASTEGTGRRAEAPAGRAAPTDTGQATAARTSLPARPVAATPAPAAIAPVQPPSADVTTTLIAQAPTTPSRLRPDVDRIISTPPSLTADAPGVTRNVTRLRSVLDGLSQASDSHDAGLEDAAIALRQMEYRLQQLGVSYGTTREWALNPNTSADSQRQQLQTALSQTRRDLQDAVASASHPEDWLHLTSATTLIDNAIFALKDTPADTI